MIHGLGSAIFENAVSELLALWDNANAPCVPFHHSGFFYLCRLDQEKGWRQHCGLSCASCLQKSTHHTTAAWHDSCSLATVKGSLTLLRHMEVLPRPQARDT